MTSVIQGLLRGVIGGALVIWALGVVFFAWARHVQGGRPPGWPWTLPLWPLMLGLEAWEHWRHRRRLLRAWKRQ